MTLSQSLALKLEHLRRSNIQRHPQLEQLFWESTLRCNAHCLHCGSDCVSSTLQPDMPAADFLKVIDEQITPHTDPHHVLIVISGGEPLMRSDLEQIGSALSKRGYPWGMVTNGIAMSEQRYRALRRAGLCSLSISFDGLEEDHNWLRQHPLAFERATQAIRMAAADPHLVWDVITCVTPRIVEQLSNLRNYLWSLGVSSWRLVSIEPMGRAENNSELLLSDAQLRKVMDFIMQERKEGRQVMYGCSGFLGDYEGYVRPQLFHCAAGLSVASILIDGSISACTSIRGKYYQGNIYRDAFWDVWEHRFAPYRDRRWMKKTAPCQDCSMWSYCEGDGMHLRREDGSLMRCHYRQLHLA